MITFLKYFHHSFCANLFTRWYIVSISHPYYFWPFPRKIQILSARSPRVRGPAGGPRVSARVVAVTVHVRLTGHVSTRAPVLAADIGALIGQTTPANHHVSLAAQLEVACRLQISCVCFYPRKLYHQFVSWQDWQQASDLFRKFQKNDNHWRLCGIVFCLCV